jgi:RNA polymerase-binding protein DksA
MPTVQTVVDLIFVKRLRSRESKLEFDNSGKTPLMSIDEFSEFCALLQAQRKQLLDEVREKIAASGEGLGFANQSKITDDDALADSAASMDVALVIRESRELQDIEAALARIADGSYGVCIDCGEEIGRARLKAYPTARRCLPCQQQDERPGARASTARS